MELKDHEANGIWQAIEEKLGLDGKDVALTVGPDGTITADCQLLSKIPQPGLNDLKDGYIYQENNDKVYVEAQEVLENNQLVLNVKEVR